MSRTEVLPPGLRRTVATELPPGLRRPVAEKLPPGLRGPGVKLNEQIPVSTSARASADVSKFFFEVKLTCAALCGHTDTGPTCIGLPVPRDIAEKEFVPYASADGAHGMQLQVYDSHGVPHTLYIRQQRVRWLGSEHAYSIRGFGHLVLKWTLQSGDFFVFRRSMDRICISYKRMHKIIHSIGAAKPSDCAAKTLATDCVGPEGYCPQDTVVDPDGQLPVEAVHAEVAVVEQTEDTDDVIIISGGKGNVAVQAEEPWVDSKTSLEDESDSETVVEDHASVRVPDTPDQGKQPVLANLIGRSCTLQMALHQAQEQQSAPPVATPLETPGEPTNRPSLETIDSWHTHDPMSKAPVFADAHIDPRSTAVSGAVAPVTPTKLHVATRECLQDTDRQPQQSRPQQSDPSRMPRPQQCATTDVPADMWAQHQQRIATSSGHAIVHSYGNSATHPKRCNARSRVGSADSSAPCHASGSDCGSSMRAIAAHMPELQAVAHWFPDALPMGSFVRSVCEIEGMGGDTEDEMDAGEADSCCTMPEYSITDETCADGSRQHFDSIVTCAEGTQVTAMDSLTADENARGEVTSKRSNVAQAVTDLALMMDHHEAQGKAEAAACAGSKCALKSDKVLGRKLEKEGQQARKRRRTCIEARQAERDKGRVAKGKSSFLFGSFGGACISFSNNKATLKQLLELPQGGERAKAYGSFATYCTRMLHMCGVDVQRETKERGSEVVSLEVPVDLLQQFPVLQDLWEAVGDNPVDEGSACDSTSTSFHPPASLWALACLILVGDGDADLWHIFGNPSRQARLLADTLEMAHYLNDTQACPQLNTWMLEVFAEVVQAFKSDDGFTVCPDDAPAVWHLCEVLLAVSEQHSIFAQLASQPPPDLPKPRSRARTAAKSMPNSHAADACNKGIVHAGRAEGKQQSDLQQHTATESDKTQGSEDTSSTHTPIMLADIPAEDVLNLPPPLCHAWFRHMRTIAVRLDSSNSAARHVATGALCSATAVEELALYVCATQVSSDERSAAAESALDTNPHASYTERRTRSKGKGPGSGGVASGSLATSKAAPAVPAAPPCSFAMVQQCLIAPRQLRALHMHGVRLLPHELQSFGSALRWLAPSLEKLTLCRIQGLDDARTHAHAPLSCAAGTVSSRKGSASEKTAIANSDRALSVFSYAVDEKRLLCNALAQLCKLQVLTFPELYEFVCRGTDVLRPMSCMDSLKVVYVHPASVSKLCRAEPGMHFQPLPGEGCSCQGM